MAKIAPGLEDLSLLQFYPGKELYNEGSNWFSPSMSALIGLISTAGFHVEHSANQSNRGYLRARSIPGRPRFIIADGSTYEGLVYRESGLERLFGPIELWD